MTKTQVLSSGTQIGHASKRQPNALSRAALATLYPFPSPLSISHLSPTAIQLYTAILSQLPSSSPEPDVAFTQAKKTYVFRTQKLIANLPRNLINPSALYNLPQANLTKAFRVLGADESLPPAAHLCHLHRKLNAQVIASALDTFEGEVEDHLRELEQQCIEHEHSHQQSQHPGCKYKPSILASEIHSLYVAAAALLATRLPVDEFIHFYGSPPPPSWTTKTPIYNPRCSACILARVGSSPDLLTALRTSLLARASEGVRNGKEQWSSLDWIESWIRELRDEEIGLQILMRSGRIAAWSRGETCTQDEYEDNDTSRDTAPARSRTIEDLWLATARGSGAATTSHAGYIPTAEEANPLSAVASSMALPERRQYSGDELDDTFYTPTLTPSNCSIGYRSSRSSITSSTPASSSMGSLLSTPLSPRVTKLTPPPRLSAPPPPPTPSQSLIRRRLHPRHAPTALGIANALVYTASLPSPTQPPSPQRADSTKHSLPPARPKSRVEPMAQLATTLCDSSPATTPVPTSPTITSQRRKARAHDSLFPASLLTTLRPAAYDTQAPSRSISAGASSQPQARTAVCRISSMSRGSDVPPATASPHSMPTSLPNLTLSASTIPTSLRIGIPPPPSVTFNEAIVPAPRLIGSSRVTFPATPTLLPSQLATQSPRRSARLSAAQTAHNEDTQVAPELPPPPQVQSQLLPPQAQAQMRTPSASDSVHAPIPIPTHLHISVSEYDGLPPVVRYERKPVLTRSMIWGEVYDDE